MDKPREEWTADEWRDRTVEARRSARFKFASDRINKIVSGMPPLTEQQLSALAILLRSEVVDE